MLFVNGPIDDETRYIPMNQLRETLHIDTGDGKTHAYRYTKLNESGELDFPVYVYVGEVK
jgi:hypothetical protein